MDPDAMDLDTPPPEPPYNPYASLPSARQTNEPIAAFLQRLPPATNTATPAHLLPPWYWIANPRRSAYRGGRADTGDVAAFTRAGRALLDEARRNLAQCARNDPVRTQLRAVLGREIEEAARRCGVTSGKWMLFPRVEEVNETWRAVCEGVDADRLGTAAKVSTSGLEGDAARLICVYSKDFTDIEDVRRVLLGLVAMGLVREDMPRGVMYKCDAYTYLDIYGKNEFGLRASIYNSKEMLGGGCQG